MRIYCDTSALRHNISRHNDQKSQTELAAVNQLAERYPLFGSHLVRYEVGRTKNEIQRGALIIDVDGLQNVPKDEKLLGFNVQISQYTCINSPIISDVQDEAIRAELIEQGLEQRDAEHITQAVCNDCDVFITCDKKTIIRHRGWLQKRFPTLKVLRPSELVESITAQSMVPTAR